MPAPVIAAVDPATDDPSPARLGALLAAYAGSQLVVAGVYASDEVVTRLAGGQHGEELPRTASDVLDALVLDLGRDGVDAEAMALGASTAPRALELAAQELGAGLIVLGSARRGGPGRVAVGSVSGRLLNGAPCAVAVVPAGWERRTALGTIGVGFVDGAEGRAAVEAAGALADRAGSALRILAAVTPRSWMNGSRAELEAELRTRAEEAAAGTTRGPVDERVDIDVAVAEPADFLLDASAELDLLVCGARAYGPEGVALLGGVTRRAVEAACPVVVLARGGGSWLDAA